MIKIFKPTDTSFASNGDVVLQATKAKVHKADNGDFYLSIEAPLTYAPFIKANNIIVAPTPQGEQAFRITTTELTKSKVKCKAWHVFYDSKNYLIEDSYVVNKDCNGALDHLNSATEPKSPFTTLSDITALNSYRCVRKSLYEAFMEVVSRWGGHLVRDNWNVQIRASIGKDNGVTIRYGKNLQDINATYNWDNVVTKILPVGKDGLMLPEKYLSSDTQYGIPYTKTISFSQSSVSEDDYKDADGKTNEEAYQQALLDDLRVEAQDYLAKHSVPQANYTIKADVDRVSDVGDSIEVIDERLGISLMTNVISYDYDCVLGKYTQLEFGNFTQSLNTLISDVSSSADNAIKKNNNALAITLGEQLQTAQDKIWNALGSSYVIYEGDKILIVDSIPKEEAKNVIRINNGGIAFSSNGIDGAFTSAWTIDNTLNMEAINVINLTANLIKGGTLKLGSNLNQNGSLEVYDEANTLIATLNKDGLKMYGKDGSHIVINNEVGFIGYDSMNNPVYWVHQDEFHMKKAVVEEDITLSSKMRFIPIKLTDSSGNVTSDGIGLVSVKGGND